MATTFPTGGNPRSMKCGSNWVLEAKEISLSGEIGHARVMSRSGATDEIRIDRESRWNQLETARTRPSASFGLRYQTLFGVTPAARNVGSSRRESSARW